MAATFAPKAAQPGIFALRAFNVETARIRDLVKDANIGRIRLQWWRETLDRVFKKDAPEHPVAQALVAVLSEHRLRRKFFDRIIDARARLSFLFFCIFIFAG